MDFFSDKPNDEILAKVRMIARFFDAYCNSMNELAESTDDQIEKFVAQMVSVTLKIHAFNLFEGLDKEEMVTNNRCYELIFQINEKSVPFIVELEERLDGVGISTVGVNGEKASDILRQLVSF